MGLTMGFVDHLVKPITFSRLESAIDRFFDEVMVMAENEAVRNNRLALLAELLREFTTVADFSEIGGEERR